MGAFCTVVVKKQICSSSFKAMTGLNDLFSSLLIMFSMVVSKVCNKTSYCWNWGVAFFTSGTILDCRGCVVASGKGLLCLPLTVPLPAIGTSVCSRTVPGMFMDKS